MARRFLDKGSHKDDPPAGWDVLASEAVAGAMIVWALWYFDVIDWLRSLL